MKTFLCTLLVFLAGGISAQPFVWTAKQAREKQFRGDEFQPLYGENVANQVLERISETLDKVIAKDVNPGIAVMLQVLINANGKPAYIIFDLSGVKGYHIDSLNNVIRKAFEAGVTDWQFEEQKAAFRIIGMMKYGKEIKERRVRHTDSSVVDIKEALATVDTLKVKRIFFNQLDLKTLPDVMYRFPNAEEIYLTDNLLTEVNINLKRFPKLKQLDLQGNSLTDKKLGLSSNTSLEVLNLKSNQFRNIPKAARNCKHLVNLWMGGNKMSGLKNGSFKKLKQVLDLNLYKCEIAVLPRGIKKMKNLQVLDLYYNHLKQLPDALTNLKQLKQLAVSYNQIVSLPEHIGDLKDLEILYAHHNHLSALPKGVGELQKITVLDLGYNWFYDFPTVVVSLDSLQEFDISANNLPVFPAEITRMKNLEKVHLRGNPFIEKNEERKYAAEIEKLKVKNVEVFY